MRMAGGNCVEINELPKQVGGFFDHLLRIIGLKKDSDADLIDFIVRGPVAKSLGWSKEEVAEELDKWHACEHTSCGTPPGWKFAAIPRALPEKAFFPLWQSSPPRKKLGQQLATDLKADHANLNDAQRRDASAAAPRCVPPGRERLLSVRNAH